MVHIIGVDHLVQYNGPVPETIRDEFRAHIETLCRDLSIGAIAEEFSEYALSEVYHASAETAQEAARTLGITHRYCDPGGSELAEMGIPGFGDLLEESKHHYNATSSYLLDDGLRKKVAAYAVKRARSYWDMRERYWLSRLRDLFDINILFICGHEHVERFGSLLAEHGVAYRVIERFWREDLLRDYGAIGLL